MQPSLRLGRFVNTVALAAFLVVLSGCALLDGRARIRSSSRSAGSSYPEVAEKGNRGPTDTYYSITGTKKADGSFGFVKFARDLWAPFRWEITLGAFNPDRDPGAARLCTELDVKGSNPLQFYLLCAQAQPNGSMLVYAGWHNGNLDFLVFNNTTEVDLAIEADGEDLIFLARPRGVGLYQEVDRVAFSNQTIALQPSFGASSLDPNGEGGFDLFRVVENGGPPLETAADDDLREQVWRAADDAFEALYDLDGEFPNRESAAANLAGSLDGLTAVTDEADLTSSKPRKKVAKGIKKGGKKLNQAFAGIGKGKPDAKMVKTIAKALQALLVPLAGLDDE